MCSWRLRSAAPGSRGPPSSRRPTPGRACRGRRGTTWSRAQRPSSRRRCGPVRGRWRVCRQGAAHGSVAPSANGTRWTIPDRAVVPHRRVECPPGTKRSRGPGPLWAAAETDTTKSATRHQAMRDNMGVRRKAGRRRTVEKATTRTIGQSQTVVGSSANIPR